ncbi:serine/threonine-protein kinase [Streptomyces lavendofoliae]|uniref:non-specific serine/threonine protein kinase n=1 Tax=Streptomyces lavendofoliae TaxID=67314 RepID=A0A918HWS6_9ACTN|nr:serine/threonine-protein kinase [Streptomyces lavendofoliae]GGU38784.1 serine/threonine protein kinase [Streptomyces lavendofoliae]
MGDTRLLQGRYRLEEVIGRGGMGEVWRATDEALGRRVAVKRLKPPGPRHDRDFVTVLRERFRREARVAAALQHRGITVVHDFGESEGQLYLVMELLEGRNLSQLLEANAQHPLPVHDVVDIAEQVADALVHTHRQGIVHRDLKPANIMRLDDGTVKICDFGIARLGGDIGFTSRLTGTGIAMGTPHYMSPEQISGGPVDHRSDLYSLGCVLYEIATGAPPFDLDDPWAILVGHRDTPPEPLRNRRAELPESFERAVLDLLAKTPDDRPTDAADLRRRITGARPAPTAVLDAPFPLAPAHPTAPRLPSWTRGMTTGHKAVGAVLPHMISPPGPVAGLTGEWTAPTAAATSAPVPSTGPRGTARPPSGRVADPAPPQALAHLADRHGAALGLGRLGRWEEAAEAHGAVADERERVLGPDHRDTLTSRYEAGYALSRTGRDAEALRQFVRAAEGRTRVLGPDHPGTLAAREETAYALGRLGRHVEAHGLYTAVLDSRTRVMGADHPDTLRCRHDLAISLGRLGRPEEAYRAACDVAAARARLLGPEHPETLACYREVAAGLGRLGRWTEALAAYRHVAEARDRVLGATHPDALASRDDEARCLRRLGRHTEAVELYRRLAERRGGGGGRGGGGSDGQGGGDRTWRTGADACYEGP